MIDTILQKQQKKRIFTVLDLKHGYHQMRLHPDSRPCTAMSTPLGPMQWKVVPMGAKNGDAVLQGMIEDLPHPPPRGARGPSCTPPRQPPQLLRATHRHPPGPPGRVLRGGCGGPRMDHSRGHGQHTPAPPP